MPMYKVTIKSPFVIRCDEGEGCQLIDNLKIGDVFQDDNDYNLTEIRSKSQIPKGWDDALPFTNGGSDDDLTCKELLKLPLIRIECDECTKTAEFKCLNCAIELCEKCSKGHECCSTESI